MIRALCFNTYQVIFMFLMCIQRNGKLVELSDRVSHRWDGKKAKLELTDLSTDDTGIYTCVAENEKGTTRCSAELLIIDETDSSDTDLSPPVFLEGLKDNTYCTEGCPLELQVRLQGTNPMDIVWVKDGLEIPDCEDFRYINYGDGRFSLQIADVFSADSGTWKCEAFNEHGEGVTTGCLTVTETRSYESSQPYTSGLYFTKTPVPVITTTGCNASFCAKVHNVCKSHYTFDWTVAGRPVPTDSNRFKVEVDNGCSILHITDVKPEDEGPVTCIAHVCINGGTPVTISCSSSLCIDSEHMGSPATILQGPADISTLVGETIVLETAFTGHPKPNVRWLKAGRELLSGGRVNITTEGNVSSLQLAHITTDDSGKYVVNVENAYGADCHFASVAVEGPPEPPAGRPSVSIANKDSVTVAWSCPPYDGGSVLIGYTVEMKITAKDEWNVIAERCHSLSHLVSGLAHGQVYLFRVCAVNIHGASEASMESLPVTLDYESISEENEDYEPTLELGGRQVGIERGEEFFERYQIHEELGKGRYGVVHKVTELKSGHKMAAKFVRCIKKQDREKVQEEIDIMNCLRHPKLLQLVAAFDNPKEIIMVLEYISGGELFERVVADDFTLTERDCIVFMRQICEGVEYMHQNHVVHLDLKPENIMCHTRTSHKIKLIDFGLAQKLKPDTPVRVLFGTPEFIPPEIINYEPIGTQSDMWSVGVICYVLLSGLSPFMGDNDAETFANITRADYDFDDEAFDAISQDAKDFISILLIKRKENRMSATECLQHAWMKQINSNTSCVKLSTDKLKKFIIRRKWQKTGNAIRALGRMATLSAASRRNSSTSSSSNSPRPSISSGGIMSRMSSLETATDSECSGKSVRSRMCSERSDSGISDCSSINVPVSYQHQCQCSKSALLSKKYSISEETETDTNIIVDSTTNTLNMCKHPLKINQLTSPFLNNHFVSEVNSNNEPKTKSDSFAAAKLRTTNRLRSFPDPAALPPKVTSVTLQKDAKILQKNENFQKAFAFWKQ